MRILFVCLGNICRSPTAEGVMRRRLEREGLEGRIEVDSAGTGDWHTGEPPDERAAAAAGERGIRLASSGRQIRPEDFESFDLILAMDAANLADLRAAAPDADVAEARVRLLRSFDRRAVASGDLEVPDPYFGGEEGFDRVLDMVEAACAGLLAELRAQRRV